MYRILLSTETTEKSFTLEDTIFLAYFTRICEQTVTMNERFQKINDHEIEDVIIITRQILQMTVVVSSCSYGVTELTTNLRYSTKYTKYVLVKYFNLKTSNSWSKSHNVVCKVYWMFTSFAFIPPHTTPPKINILLIV